MLHKSTYLYRVIYDIILPDDVWFDLLGKTSESFDIRSWQRIFDIGKPDTFLFKELDPFNGFFAGPGLISINGNLHSISHSLSNDLQATKISHHIRASHFDLYCGKTPPCETLKKLYGILFW